MICCCCCGLANKVGFEKWVSYKLTGRPMSEVGEMSVAAWYCWCDDEISFLSVMINL